MAPKLLYKIPLAILVILFFGSLLGCTASAPSPQPSSTPEPITRPATPTPAPLPTATIVACVPSPIQNSDIGFSEIQGTLSTEGEVWALLFFSKAQVERELKIVWKITGESEKISVEAKHEDGTVVLPAWGPEKHEGSNWDRPGAEWGTGFNFPKPGCWTLTATHGTVTGEIRLEVLPSVSTLALEASPVIQSQNEASQADQAIYSLLSNDGGELLVLLENTATTENGGSNFSEYSEYMKQCVAEIEQDTLNDFIKKNEQSYLLQKYFAPTASHMFLKDKEYQEIFNNEGDEWSRFYAKYPDASGFRSFSRIGFNSTLTQALVYKHYHLGYGAGGDDFIFLIKENGSWIVKHKCGIGIS